MKSSIYLVILVGLSVLSFEAFAQRSSSSRISLKPRQIHKLPKVDLDLLEKDYPRSYLYRVKNNSITLINRSVHAKTHETIYFMGDVDFSEINAMTVVDRRRRFKTNLWGALAGGIVGYTIGKLAARDDFNQISIEILNQQPKAGFIEPILGTIVGASLGIAIGDLFTPVRLKDVYKNPRKTSLYLRGLTKKKRKRR